MRCVSSILVLRVLRDGGICSIRQLRSRSGFSREVVLGVIKRAAGAGYVARVAHACYRLEPAGLAWLECQRSLPEQRFLF